MSHEKFLQLQKKHVNVQVGNLLCIVVVTVDIPCSTVQGIVYHIKSLLCSIELHKEHNLIMVLLIRYEIYMKVPTHVQDSRNHEYL